MSFIINIKLISDIGPVSVTYLVKS